MQGDRENEIECSGCLAKFDYKQTVEGYCPDCYDELCSQEALGEEN